VVMQNLDITNSIANGFEDLPPELVLCIADRLDTPSLRTMRALSKNMCLAVESHEEAWKRVYLEQSKVRSCMPVHPKGTWFDSTYRYCKLTFDERFALLVVDQIESVPSQGLQMAKNLYTGFRVDTSKWQLESLCHLSYALSCSEKGLKILSFLLELLFHEWCSQITNNVVQSPKNIQKTKFQLMFEQRVESVEAICSFLNDSVVVKTVAQNVMNDALNEHPELARQLEVAC